MLALEGIRILDFSRVHSGPVGTQVLGDLGAEVIKIEKIGSGDYSRSQLLAPELHGESNSFLALNRNKRSVCVNLRHAEGREIVLKLLATSDVLVHNFRPGVMERLDLDYGSVAPHSPRLIYASVTGFGPTGPYRLRPGQDLVAQAIAGALWMNGARASAPSPSGIPLADFSAGMLLVQGILAALLVRARCGKGQEVSVSLLDAIMAPQCEFATSYLTSGLQPANPCGALYRTYLCADDKWLALSFHFSDNAVRATCGVLGLPDRPQDTRFDSWEEANEDHAEELSVIFAERFLLKERAEWLPLLEAAGILSAPVNTYAEAFADPQVLHNQILMEYEHPIAGRVTAIRWPVRLSLTPATLRMPPPRLGGNTDDVLETLGYTQQEIAALRDQHVVG